MDSMAPTTKGDPTTDGSAELLRRAGAYHEACGVAVVDMKQWRAVKVRRQAAEAAIQDSEAAIVEAEAVFDKLFQAKQDLLQEEEAAGEQLRASQVHRQDLAARLELAAETILPALLGTEAEENAEVRGSA